MLKDALTLSALIAAVLLVRAAFKNRVPKRLIYALWLVVLLKLCLPGTAYALPLLPAEQTAAAQQTETPAQLAPAAQQPTQAAAQPQTPAQQRRRERQARGVAPRLAVVVRDERQLVRRPPHAVVLPVERLLRVPLLHPGRGVAPRRCALRQSRHRHHKQYRHHEKRNHLRPVPRQHTPNQTHTAHCRRTFSSKSFIFIKKLVHGDEFLLFFLCDCLFSHHNPSLTPKNHQKEENEGKKFSFHKTGFVLFFTTLSVTTPLPTLFTDVL